MSPLGPALAQFARWEAMLGPREVALTLASLAFAAVSSLAIAGRRR